MVMFTLSSLYKSELAALRFFLGFFFGDFFGVNFLVPIGEGVGESILNAGSP